MFPNEIFWFNFHRIHFVRAILLFFPSIFKPFTSCIYKVYTRISNRMPCHIFNKHLPCWVLLSVYLYVVFFYSIESYFEISDAPFLSFVYRPSPHRKCLELLKNSFACSKLSVDGRSWREEETQRANTWWILKMCTDVMHVIQFNESHSKFEF